MPGNMCSFISGRCGGKCKQILSYYKSWELQRDVGLRRCITWGYPAYFWGGTREMLSLQQTLQLWRYAAHQWSMVSVFAVLCQKFVLRDWGAENTGALGRTSLSPQRLGQQMFRLLRWAVSCVLWNSKEKPQKGNYFSCITVFVCPTDTPAVATWMCTL